MARSISHKTRCTILAAGVALVASALVSCADAEVPAAKGCAPLETPEPNAPDQRPAFAGQTRACADRSNVAFDVVVLAKGLEKPWAVEPLPNGDLLVTEKVGKMRIVTAKGDTGEAIAGVPAVDARGQGGLLDVALSPGFPTDNTVYWSYSEPRQGGNATSVARGVLSADRARLADVRVIFRALPVYDGDKHYGSRLAFGPDGMLYVTLGERSDKPMRPQAQQLDSHMGKIVRIAPDGSVPPDNPFAKPQGRAPGDLVDRSSQHPGGGVRFAGAALGSRARHARRRRAQPHRARPQLRLAGGRLRESSTRGSPSRVR